MKQNLLLILLLAPFLLIAQNTPIDSIPFKLEKDNRIYTYCKVNNSDSLYFLIDTGASDMVINSEVLSKVDMHFDSSVTNLGTTGENSIKLSSTNTFLWGNQVFDKTPFISIPYPDEKFEGVLGLKILRQYVVEINYDAMCIYLYDKKGYQNLDANKLKINYVSQVPTIKVEIETINKKTHCLNLEIDTGSDRIIDISTSYVNKNKLLDVYRSSFATSNITSSDGKSGLIYNVYFPKVTISEFEMYKLPGGVAQVQFGMMNRDDLDGIIGNWFLKRFNLTFDFENDYLSLEPNNNMYSPFYDFLTQ